MQSLVVVKDNPDPSSQNKQEKLKLSSAIDSLWK
ncbi:hypothetical protein SAMN04488559_10580 [Isobaculum melis]|uniref:Uncharacterized protein n=1 Tax=Isobaculum melis TaxID=142588 RepID=A0A1H9RTE0_9LACT|nr:hypothetical protein SAMN04488559_10580 [Isobaculum melis]